MTQEQKQLLLVDLCSRLPYGVKCNALFKQIDGSLKSVFGTFKGYNNWATVGNNLVDIETVKPYLRPMSSMTMEEECEFCRLFECDSVNAMYGYINWVGGSCDYDEFDIEFSKLAKIIDWLNEHHFDYRGLLPKGLALEAPEGMYNIK